MTSASALGNAQDSVTSPSRKGNRKMSKIYETVKHTNGYAITRMKGTKGCYHIKTTDNKEHSFKTIKEASAFATTLPYKPTRLAYAIGMARTAIGYIRKETLYFALTDDNARNKQIIDEFAKKHKCNIVEVWYRNDNEWGTIIPYKIYSYLHNIDEETFDKIAR